MDFLSKTNTPLDFFVFFFALVVVFINGWTDAPGSIFSIVSSGRLKLWQGALLSGIFNFLGVFISSLVGASVAKSIFSIVSISSRQSTSVVCLSCFITVVLFGVIAWFFGLPSSESHAMIFSLFGALFALGIQKSSFVSQVIYIIFSMIFSCVCAYFISFLVTALTKKLQLPYKNLLPFSCAALSFTHGAQDGQKFLGVLLFVLSIGADEYPSTPPFTLILLVSLVMALSTLLGGGRIIKTLSKTSSALDYHSSFSSDIGSFLTIALCSTLGMPISTGNVKSLSIIGCATCKKEYINKKMTGKILLASVITLPACFIIGYILCKIIMRFL